MLILIFIMIFVGSFCFYTSSDSMKIKHLYFIEVWLKSNSIFAKLLGGLFYGLAFVISIQVIGFSSGILYCFIFICVVLSLLIILRPLILRDR